MIITSAKRTRLSAAIFSVATCLAGCAPLPPATYRVGNNPASMTAAEAQQELIRTTLEPQITPPLDAPLRLVRVVLPEYPLGSLRRGVEGKVRLTFRVLGDGTVDQVKVVEGPNDELSTVARDAVAQWKFGPVTRNGAAVTLRFAFTYQFELNVTPSR